LKLINHNSITIKKIEIFFTLSLLLFSCSTNPNYERNLATAKKIFELHGQEDLEGQLNFVSKEIKSVLPMYGSEPVGYEDYANIIKIYHNAFDDLKYTADTWLPGTDGMGNLDGSVRTYGNWTGFKNIITGKKLNLNGYWCFNFDDTGLINEQGDFFDVGGYRRCVF